MSQNLAIFKIYMMSVTK